jgi:hypothetical protein
MFDSLSKPSGAEGRCKMEGFTLVSGVLPKSNVGRKAVPAKPELVAALVAAFDSATAEVINSDGDVSAKVYGPPFLFESEAKARTDAKRYVTALAENHNRKCTVNVYPATENYVGKIVGADGNTLRFTRVFGTNEQEAREALAETLSEGESVATVETQTRYLWRLYVPLSGEDGGRTEPLPVAEEDSAEVEPDDNSEAKGKK